MMNKCYVNPTGKFSFSHNYEMTKFSNGWDINQIKWAISNNSNNNLNKVFLDKMMNRLEKYYEPHPQQILRRTHNTMLMLPPPPLIQEGHGSITSSRAGTWSGYNIAGITKQRVSWYFSWKPLTRGRVINFKCPVHLGCKWVMKLEQDVRRCLKEKKFRNV